MILRSVLTGLALSLAAVSTADAGPRMTQARADAHVLADAQFQVDEGPAASEQDTGYVLSFELDPCEVISSRRAECVGTMYYSDGDACDFAYDVKITRRGRLVDEFQLEVCDSDY